MTTNHISNTIPVAEARRVIDECGVTSPDDIDVTLIAARYDAFVREQPLHGADGIMVRKGKEALISVRDSIPEPGKKRFVIAHELGHVLLHPAVKQHDLLALGEVDRLSYRQSPEEVEANYFAAEFLMPQQFFTPLLGRAEPSFTEIERLATIFRTTLSATAIQFTKYSKEPCVFAISKNLQRPWFCIPYGFEFRVRIAERVHAFSCAAEVLKSGRRVIRASDVPAGVWFENFSDTGKDYITEESFALGDTGLVYSLIWVHDVL